MEDIVISEREWMSVRFYMGDPEVVSGGMFRGGPKAYNTINALLHPGTENEKDKAREGRVIRLEDPEHLDSYLRLIGDVFRAMEKYRLQKLRENASRRITCRIDRFSSLERFVRNQNCVYGFFSTCKYGFLPEYAHAKADIVLLEADRDETVPWLDFEEALGTQYAKPEEAEILLPFGMRIRDMEQIPLTEQEKEIYTDLNNRPPCGKWRLSVTMPGFSPLPERELRDLHEAVTDEAAVEQIRRSMKQLSAGRDLPFAEEVFYGEWKKNIQKYLCGSLAAVL